MTEPVLAGWSWVTPLGRGTEALERIRAGETALAPPSDALAPYGVPYLAQVPDQPASSQHARVLHRMSLLGLEAAIALAEGWSGDRARLGVFTALGGLRALWEDLLVGLSHQVEDGSSPWARGLGKVHPYWMLRHLSNNTHAALAMSLKAQGDGATYAGANAGAQAVSGATRALRAGVIDAALVLGVDTLIQPEILLEGALHHRFDEIGPGEAAVALLLTAEGEGPRIRAFAGIYPETRPDAAPRRALTRPCRGTLSQGERGKLALPSPPGRGWRVAPGEGRLATRTGFIRMGRAEGTVAISPELPGEAQPIPVEVERALGQLGAVTALAQIVVAASLGPGRWTAESHGPPELYSRIWVHTPASERT